MRDQEVEQQHDLAALAAAAARIEAYREKCGLSFAQLRRRFAGVGSDRQYSRILQGEIPRGSVPTWLAEYEAVCRLIEMAESDALADDPIYDDLTFAKAARIAVRDAMSTGSLRRLVILQAPSGQGKSTIGRLLATQFGQRVVRVECDETCKTSPNAFLAAILAALGTQADRAGAASNLARVIARLRESRRLLILDEGHHLGPATLNLLKTLVNQTPGEFLLLTIPSLWRKLERETAYEECRQLTGNRMGERVWMSTLPDADAATFLRRRLDWDAATAAPAVKALAALPPEVRTLSCLALMVRRARQLSQGEPVTPETFEQAAAAIARSR
jgi:type II secretory pathway predicted ATPase ExeA